MAMYSVLQVINHRRVTEHTNVGVVLFDDAGNYFGAKADTPMRAVARGDLPAENVDFIHAEYFMNLMKNMKTLDNLKRALGSMGHAMSSVQHRDPLWTVKADDEALERLFNMFVKGEREPPKPKGDGPTEIESVLGG